MPSLLEQEDAIKAKPMIPAKRRALFFFIGNVSS
jgi:hypothetical protein